MYIIKINTKININEKFSISEMFTKCGQFSNISPHLKKTDVSREKLKINLQANITPQACFFIRKFRTPKINLAIDLFSMVERNRHALSVATVPVGVVSHPFTLYRQTVTSLAESLLNITQETAKMFYKFILLGKNRLHLTILADSEQQARNRLNLTRAICYARINPNHYRTLGGAYV